jgi:D-alanyl-D-alanine carboxypeptidase
LERNFANNGLSWLRPSLGTVDNLAPIDAAPPNLRDEMCGGHRKRPASDEDDTVAGNAGNGEGNTLTFFADGLQPPPMKPSEMLAQAPAPSEPIVVYTGPKKTGTDLVAAVAADADKQATPRRGKKQRLAAKKPDASPASKDAKGDAKASAATAETKPAAKPAGVKHANARPEATTAKPPGSTAQTAAKPAPKPKAATKPAPKSSTTGDAKPAADQKSTATPRS